MALKDVVRKVYNKLLVNNEGYLKYLRSCGVTIGEDVTFHCPGETHVDVTDPHLLTIGDHVNLTGPITILTHDFSWSVVKGKTGEILGNEKPVTIGNNVFVGWGATILCGTTIEDNVIIGAHAVVSGHVEGDSVWGGGSRSEDLFAGALPGEACCLTGRGGQGVCASLPGEAGSRPHARGDSRVFPPVRGSRASLRCV